MKKHKSLFILLGVLAVLIVVYLAVGQVQKKKEDEASKDKSIQVLKFDNITSIQYSNSTERRQFVKEDGTWYSAEDKEFPLKQSYLESMEDAFGDIQAERELKDGDTLEAYGLENPAYVILLGDDEGNEETIYIGNGAGDDYYLTIGDKKKVYTVSADIVNVMIFNLESMVQMEAFPVISSESIKTVSVTKSGETTTYDSANSDQEEDITAIGGGLGAAYFVGCTDYNVQEGELAQYGLDAANRTTVSVVYTDSDETEQTFTLYVGAGDENGSNYYVQMDGSTMVYTMTKEIVENIMNVEES